MTHAQDGSLVTNRRRTITDIRALKWAYRLPDADRIELLHVNTWICGNIDDRDQVTVEWRLTS
ncbi:MAG: hypothetical protein LC667_15210 [Thioalkalivibrio sp.]|nr:hypothetical protein [Thioalkalivibrio sp.]